MEKEEKEIKQDEEKQEVTVTNTNKKSAAPIIAIVIVVALVLVTGLVLFVLPNVLLNGKTVIRKEISTVFNSAREKVDEVDKKVLNYDLEKDTLGLDGSLSIDSNYKESGIDLSKLKNYKINYGAVISKKDDQASAKLSLVKNKKDLIGLNTFIDKENAYISLGDIYNKPIITEIDSRIKDIEVSKNGSVKDIKRLLDRTEVIVKDSIEDKDIKKTSVEKEVNGKKEKLTKVEYKLNTKKLSNKVIDGYLKDSEIIKILSNLTGQDEKEIKSSLKDTKEELKNTEEETITVNVYLKGLFNEVKVIEIGNEETIINIIKEGNNYKYNLTSDKEKVLYGEYISSENKLTFETDEVKLSIEEEKDTYKISLKYEDNDQSIKVDATIKNTVKKDTQSTNATIKLEYKSGEEKIDATISNDLNIEKNKKVEKLDTKNAVETDEITEEELMNIYTKVIEKVSEVVEDIAPDMANNLQELM